MGNKQQALPPPSVQRQAQPPPRRASPPRPRPIRNDARGDAKTQQCDSITHPERHEMAMLTCRTCSFDRTEYMCIYCAEACHKGHRVEYLRSGLGFCSCGTNPRKWNCQCVPKVENTQQVVALMTRAVQNMGVLVMPHNENTLVALFEDTPVILKANDEFALVQIQTPERVPQQYRENMGEYICRANYYFSSEEKELSVGCLDMDVDDGQLLFRDGICYSGMTEAQLLPLLIRMIQESREVWKRHQPGINAIQRGEDPERAALAIRNGGGGSDPGRLLAELLIAMLQNQSPRSNASTIPPSPSPSSDSSSRPSFPNTPASRGGTTPPRRQAPAFPFPDSEPAAARPSPPGGAPDLTQTTIRRLLPVEQQPFYIPLSQIKVDFDDDSKTIGEGGYGKVHLGSYLGQNYAIKVALSEESSEAEQAALLDEIKLQMSIAHPSVVQVVGISKRNGQWLMVSEFCKYRNLGQALADKALAPKLTWTVRLQIAERVAQGFAYLASKSVIHRDLKPENIMLTENFVPKIGDFGLARRLENGKYEGKEDEEAGTPIYRAPETATDEYDIGFPVDIFSFSMVLYQLFTNRRPYYDTDVQDAMIALQVSFGKRPSIPSNLPAKHRMLLETCWDGDPSKRPSWQEIIVKLKELANQQPPTL